jgi:hypothetical protein
MKRAYNQPIIQFMSLTVAVLLGGFVGITVSHVSAGEIGTTCDIQNGPCIKATSDGMKIEFDIQPKPVVALSELTFIVNLTRKGTPLTDASVSLDLSMPGMFMGRNKPILKNTKNGRFEGKGIIIRCPSGSRLWQARLTIKQENKTTIDDFVFEVK